MAVSELLQQGVNLMLLGMGMVFTFLAILVVALNGMSRLAAAISGPEEAQTASAGSAEEADSELIAVISAAINRYRKRQ
jgi:oxaloacetate decarboxylase (Na+ extruding) subunit gamma